MKRFRRLFFGRFQSTLQRLYFYEGAQQYVEDFAMRLLYYEGALKTPEAREGKSDQGQTKIAN